MVILKLAYQNMVGAGLRTWLNVSVLAFTCVLIIAHQGLFFGMNMQATRSMIQDEIAGGQYWHDVYDPYVPLTLDDAHGPLPVKLKPLVESGQGVPILIRPGTIYPQGRMQSVLLQGIDPEQNILGLPTAEMKAGDGDIPVMLGKHMAKSIGLAPGDTLTIRWRDAHGTFDARDARSVTIFDSDVVTIDKGKVWMPLATLQEMSRMPGEATMIVVGEDVSHPERVSGWTFKGHDILLKELRDMVFSKRVGGAIMYFILLFLAGLAIFDTQVLSVWRRRKEIGTLMALGMTRLGVISLFTLEGAFHGILAVAVATVVGTPLLIWMAKTGIPIPGPTEDYGFALSERLYPYYPVYLIVGTALLIMVAVTIVSFMPSRTIAKMKPTEALKGKMV